MEIKRFLEKLSSDTPTPGGGSASALAGALSASLVGMVVGLSSKKGRLKPHEIKGMGKKATTIRRRLFRAIDEDAKFYEEVLKAFRLPKGTEKERLNRSRVIQEAYKKAIVTPRVVCQHSIQLMDYCKTLTIKGNPVAMSDTGVAAFLADAALKGGLLNIGINLVSIKDQSFLKKMHSLVRKLEKKRDQLMRKIQKELIKNVPISSFNF